MSAPSRNTAPLRTTRRSHERAFIGASGARVAGICICMDDSTPGSQTTRGERSMADVDPGACARSRETYCLFCQRRRDGDIVLEFVGARYIDRLERRDGEWRIAARKELV